MIVISIPVIVPVDISVVVIVVVIVDVPVVNSVLVAVTLLTSCNMKWYIQIGFLFTVKSTELLFRESFL